MLIRPTRVAAVSCQALSPALSHAGYGSTDKPSLPECHAIAHATANRLTSRHRGRRASLPRPGPGREAGPARGARRSPRERQQKTFHPLGAGRKAPLPTGQARHDGTQAAMPRHASVPITFILSNQQAHYLPPDPSRMYGLGLAVPAMVSRSPPLCSGRGRPSAVRAVARMRSRVCSPPRLLTQLYTCIERVILFNIGGRLPRAAFVALGNDAGGARRA
jgi:hypothetical protein